MKILIVKPSSLGDVVHALPVLRLLKLHLPHSQIYWWIERRWAPLLEGDPDLAGVYLFERRRWARPAGWPELLAQVQTLRAQRFDWVIDLQGLARSAILAWLVNGQLCVGLDNPTEGGREAARAFYDLTPPRCAPGTHAVDRYRAVLPLLGVPVHGQFVWLPPRAEVAQQLRRKWDFEATCWTALVPGARWPTKRWPVEHFAQLTQRLAAAVPQVRFVVLGSAEDAPLAEPIVQAVPRRVLNLTGAVSLPELVEWLRLSRLVIAGDTGPLHLADALGTPLIALFGPTEPASTGPYRQRQGVLQNRSLPCVPCQRMTCTFARRMECLWSITPEQVCAAALERLGARAEPLPGAAAAAQGGSAVPVHQSNPRCSSSSSLSPR